MSSGATEPRLVIKICGLKTPESLECAIAAGADMIGLVFHPKSPRYVGLEQAAYLAARARGRVASVALVVDPSDSMLAEIRSAVSPDWWQFHGTERLEAIREARSILGVPVMKVIGIENAGDVAAVAAYARVADRILLDAKPPKNAAYPGGQGKPFDWRVLSALPPEVGFMLSGGLMPETVGRAIRTVRALGLRLLGVDVSSGVESALGVKDLGRIRAFIAAVRDAERQPAGGVT